MHPPLGGWHAPHCAPVADFAIITRPGFYSTSDPKICITSKKNDIKFCVRLHFWKSSRDVGKFSFSRGNSIWSSVARMCIHFCIFCEASNIYSLGKFDKFRQMSRNFANLFLNIWKRFIATSVLCGKFWILSHINVSSLSVLFASENLRQY